MNKLLCRLAPLALLAGLTTAEASDVNVGVSISGQVQPGVYGRVDIGNTPPPLLYPQPMIIRRPPQPLEPMYLHVPPGHAKNWRKHCAKYNACGHPVYFVRSAEYEPGYARRGRDDRDERGERGRGHDGGREHGRGHGRDD